MRRTDFKYVSNMKITSVIIAVVAIINFLTFVNLSQYLKHQAIDNKKSEMQSEAQILQETFSFLYKKNEHEEIQNVMASFSNKSGLLWAVLLDEKQNIFAANKKMHLESNLSSLLTLSMQKEVAKKQIDFPKHKKPQTWFNETTEAIYSLSSVPLEKSGKESSNNKKYGTLFIHFDTHFLQESIQRKLISAFLPIAFTSILGGLIIVFYFHYTVGKRIKNLKLMTNKFITDNSEGLKTNEKDDISALFQSFNQLTDWLTHVHESLFNSREHLHRIQNSISEGIISTDINGKIIDINLAAESITGLSNKSFHQQPINSCITFFESKNLTAIKDPFTPVLTSKESTNVFKALLIKDNSNSSPTKVAVRCAINPIYENNCLSGLVIVLYDLTEHSQLKANAEDLEKNYKSLFNLSRDGYVIHSGLGEVMNPNPAYTNITGYKYEELVGMSLSDLIPNKWLFWEKMHQHKKLIDQGYTDLYEIEYTHREGYTVFIETQSFLLNTPENINNAVIGTFVRNVSDRKESDENLSQYKQILSSSSDLITLIDKNYVVQTANYAFLKYFNKELSQVYQHELKDVIGTKNFEKYMLQKLSKALEGETITLKTWAYFKAAGKRYMQITCSPYFNEKSVISGLVVNARDITIEKIHEEKVRANQKQQELILNNMVDAVITIDATGVVESFNDSAVTLFGYSATEIIGKNVKVLMPETYSKVHDAYLQRHLSTLKRNIIGNAKEVSGLRKDGSEFPLRLLVSELPVGNGKQSKFIGTCHDLTLIKQQEEAMLRHQKMDALGKLTGGIAHDFNNILGIILGYCELLSLKLASTPQHLKYVENITTAGKRGADLTQKLLSFSKKKQTNVETININSLISAQHDIIQKSLTSLVELHLELSPTLNHTNIDASAFDDMLLNMCINASHAMPTGGSLYLSTINEVIEGEVANNLSLQPGNYITLSIKDTGQGMSVETREKIFEPFFTTKGDNGTGLGLSQVYGFITSCGGSINVDSILEEGTTFKLYFPCELEVTNQEKEVKEQLDTSFLKGIGTVLIVDDETLLCQFAKETIEQFNIQAVTANSGQEAVNILKETSIDVVMTDVMMPKMNGYELADIIQESYPNIKVLLVSGYQGSLAEENVNRPIPLPLVVKPYNRETLLEGLKECLSTKD